MPHDSLYGYGRCKCDNPHPEGPLYPYDYCIMYPAGLGYFYELPWPDRYAECSMREFKVRGIRKRSLI